MGNFFRVAVAFERYAPAGEDAFCFVRDGSGQTGMNRARTNAVDGDALGRQFHRQRPGEAHNAVLCRGVRAGKSAAADRFGRSNIHDPSGPAFCEMRQRRANEALVGRQIHAETALPDLVVAAALNTGRGIDTGIIDQNVEPAEMCDNPGQRRFDLRGVGEVQGPARGRTAGLGNLLDDSGNAVRISVQYGNLRLFVGKEMSGCPSHAAGGPGH